MRPHWVLQNKLLTSVIATLIFAGFVVPVNDAVAIVEGPTSEIQILNALGINILFALLFFCASFYLLRFIQLLLAGDAVYWRWLKVSTVYFAVNALLLLLIWPGYWLWDEFGVLAAVQRSDMPAWQSVYTSIYFALVLKLFPSGVAIVVFQVVLASVIVGWVVARAAEFLKHKRLAWLLFVPFLFVPVLLNNFYPLRLTVYSYLEIALFFRLILITLRPAIVQNRYREFLALTSVVALLAFWRTEGAYLLILVPILVVRLGIFRQPRGLILGSTAVLAGVAILAGTAGLASATSQPRYQLTATMNPLSLMLQGPLKGDRLSQNLADLDKVVDLDIVRAMPSPNEVPSFWSGSIREGFQAHLRNYNIAFASLVFDNPAAFLSARMQTFMSANGFGHQHLPQVQAGSTFLGATPPAALAHIERFDADNKFSDPINEEVRRAVVKSMLMAEDTTTVTPLGRVVWSLLPVSALSLAALALALLRRNYLAAGLLSLVLIRLGLVFLSAPANFFMYYLPVFMSGWFLLFFFSVRWLDTSRWAERWQARRTHHVRKPHNVVGTRGE